MDKIRATDYVENRIVEQMKVREGYIFFVGAASGASRGGNFDFVGFVSENHSDPVHVTPYLLAWST